MKSGSPDFAQAVSSHGVCAQQRDFPLFLAVIGILFSPLLGWILWALSAHIINSLHVIPLLLNNSEITAGNSGYNSGEQRGCRVAAPPGWSIQKRSCQRAARNRDSIPPARPPTLSATVESTQRIPGRRNRFCPARSRFFVVACLFANSRIPPIRSTL